MDLSKYVPLRSIWLLQLYASEVYQRGLIRDSAVEDADAASCVGKFNVV